MERRRKAALASTCSLINLVYSQTSVDKGVSMRIILARIGLSSNLHSKSRPPEKR
jgi:hypothetical protein